VRWFGRQPDIVLTMRDVESLLLIAAYADPDAYVSVDAVAMIGRANALPKDRAIKVRVIYE